MCGMFQIIFSIVSKMDIDLLFDPLAPPRYCPQCARVGIKTTVKKFKVNPCSADLVIMCKNEKAS